MPHLDGSKNEKFLRLCPEEERRSSYCSENARHKEGSGRSKTANIRTLEADDMLDYLMIHVSRHFQPKI